MIYESGIVAATTADLLSGGRLNSIPYAGKLTLDFLADLADATNNYSVKIQLPDGDVPVDGQMVPANSWGVDGVLDERQLMRFSFAAFNGGHFTVTLTESGTAVCAWRAVLSP